MEDEDITSPDSEKERLQLHSLLSFIFATVKLPGVPIPGLVEEPRIFDHNCVRRTHGFDK